MRLHSEIKKVETHKQRVFGWAYVSHDENDELVVDKSGDFIDDKENLEDRAYAFVVESRAAGHMHQRVSKAGDAPKVVGHMIESMYFDVEKAEALGVPSGILPTSAWWLGFQIEDPDVWQDVVDGKLTAFSIHGTGFREPVTN